MNASVLDLSATTGDVVSVIKFASLFDIDELFWPSIQRCSCLNSTERNSKFLWASMC